MHGPIGRADSRCLEGGTDFKRNASKRRSAASVGGNYKLRFNAASSSFVQEGNVWRIAWSDLEFRNPSHELRTRTHGGRVQRRAYLRMTKGQGATHTRYERIELNRPRLRRIGVNVLSISNIALDEVRAGIQEYVQHAKLPRLLHAPRRHEFAPSPVVMLECPLQQHYG